MLRLRPYKKCDAAHICSWIKDERTFRRWSADRFDHYPVTAEDINAYYEDAAGIEPEIYHIMGEDWKCLELAVEA